jgi:hypothetical protein
MEVCNQSLIVARIHLSRPHDLRPIYIGAVVNPLLAGMMRLTISDEDQMVSTRLLELTCYGRSPVWPFGNGGPPLEVRRNDLNNKHHHAK